MHALPDYVAIRFPDYGETPDPSVERTEMERGVPKQRILNTHVLVGIQAAFLFRSAADAESFEAWYYDTLKRIDWFTMTHPRTRQPVTARFVGGDIGTLTPLSPEFAKSFRVVSLEYLR